MFLSIHCPLFVSSHIIFIFLSLALFPSTQQICILHVSWRIVLYLLPSMALQRLGLSSAGEWAAFAGLLTAVYRPILQALAPTTPLAILLFAHYGIWCIVWAGDPCLSWYFTLPSIHRTSFVDRENRRKTLDTASGRSTCVTAEGGCNQGEVDAGRLCFWRRRFCVRSTVLYVVYPLLVVACASFVSCGSADAGDATGASETALFDESTSPTHGASITSTALEQDLAMTMSHALDSTCRQGGSHLASRGRCMLNFLWSVCNALGKLLSMQS
jgi:hypothetical protein